MKTQMVSPVQRPSGDTKGCVTAGSDADRPDSKHQVTLRLLLPMMPMCAANIRDTPMGNPMK